MPQYNKRAVAGVQAVPSSHHPKASWYTVQAWRHTQPLLMVQPAAEPYSEASVWTVLFHILQLWEWGFNSVVSLFLVWSISHFSISWRPLQYQVSPLQAKKHIACNVSYLRIYCQNLIFPFCPVIYPIYQQYWTKPNTFQQNCISHKKY